MPNQRMKLYWCRWGVPNNINRKHVAAEWPQGMQGWIVGSSPTAPPPDNGFIHWEGAVIAPSPLHAWRKVLSCYGPSKSIIVQHQRPEEKPADFEPGPSFPNYTLKVPQTETIAFEKPNVPPTDGK